MLITRFLKVKEHKSQTLNRLVEKITGDHILGCWESDYLGLV